MKNYLLLLALLGCFACKKGLQDYRHAKPVSEVKVSTYDFLQQQNGLYDTLLLLINRVHLADLLKNEKVTFFVPQDISIQTAMRNLNFARARLGDAGNWTLDSVPDIVWDSLLRRYILAGIVDADSLRYADGSDLVSLYKHGMNGKVAGTNASGQVGGGTEVIQFADRNESRFIKDWSVALTQNVDITSKNGIMHILESRHVFGFTSFVGKAYPRSLEPIQGPYLGYPVEIPGIVNAADYDEGPKEVAFHYNNPNGNHNYRPDAPGTENCSQGDNQVSAGGNYNIGWTSDGDWVRYTVNIKAAGKYKVELRIAGNGGGIIYLEIDGVKVSDEIPIQGTGGWQSWQGAFGTADLPAGVHQMKVRIKKANLNLHRIIFTKL
ncbi:carbohydrate binding protein with CBM6 domain [Chitinophaga polysaccharea]|uniref:Carbohydrate binding protein with CBM6 domain n=1 Tax=Chitinophaga polysaccharea TaxID=1293035 RepID=A0A561PL25_9BACT|nr:carbohydrate-binding protein [Chitinophaga polysaccharea]TWF38790.1 carbohydrate binding protein with CBM6 domain [Chitinophaga polysaccharea]